MSRNGYAADGAGNAGSESAGPPAGLPDAVPDFVGEIHALINEFLADGLASLGEAISEVASGAIPVEAAAVVDIATIVPV